MTLLQLLVEHKIRTRLREFLIHCGSAVVAELSVDAALLEKVLQNRLRAEDALRFASSAPECVAFTLLALQQRIASTQQAAGAHTPSAAVPPYAKANMAAGGATRTRIPSGS